MFAKQAKAPPAPEWVSRARTRTIHMWYYGTRERNKVLVHAPVWMDLETIMWHEKSQKQICTWSHTRWSAQKQKVDWWPPRVRGGGREWRVMLLGMGFLSGGDENVLELDSGDSCANEYTKNHWLIHLKQVNGMVCELYLREAVN